MPRFLVPVDFSAISVNAALYAVQMLEGMPKKEVILYNVTEEIHAGTDGTPIDFDGEALVASNLMALENLQVSLFELGMSPMEIAAEIGELTERIKPAIERYKADMVVMGSSGTSTFGNNFMGKNAMQISRENTCPVMIVPAEAIFKGSGKIAIAVEYKDVEKAVSIEPIKHILDTWQPELHFVCVGEKGQTELTAQQLGEKAKLENLFRDYNTVYKFLPSQDFSVAINDYVDKNQIDQIVVFPKKRSLFDSIFSGDHATKLAFHSHVPVITVHN